MIIMGNFATDPTPNHFHGEDVIGDEIYKPSYGNKENTNRIPQQLLQKLQNAISNEVPNMTYEEYQIQNQKLDIPFDEYEEKITIKQPFNVSVPNKISQEEVIVKTVKINLEIDLKINVV